MTQERVPKYKVGDKVKIVNYGSLIWENKNIPDQLKLYFPCVKEDENLRWLDMSPELVGQLGIITKAYLTQNVPTYALHGPNKTAWYDEEQLELIERPNYNN